MRTPIPIVALAAVLVLPAVGCDPPTEPGSPLSPGGLEVAMHPGPVWGPAVSVDPGGAANLNTAALEGCPIEAPDGKSLYFASNRDGQIDIWVSRRQGRAGAWHEPEKLPAPVNSASNDFCPTPLPGGELYFVSTRPGGCGDGTADIYRTRLHPVQGWLEPVHLGCEVNSAANEFSPSYVSVGGGMLFFSSSRAGQDDIYVSLRGLDGGWAAPEPVDALNAAGSNSARPNVSADGREIVFDSDRPGGLGGPDVWYASRATPFDDWSVPVNLGPSVNSGFGETRPSFSRDGKRLYFGSNRPAHQGNFDIFVSMRR